jgi:hypothetical protein
MIVGPDSTATAAELAVAYVMPILLGFSMAFSVYVFSFVAVLFRRMVDSK